MHFALLFCIFEDFPAILDSHVLFSLGFNTIFSMTYVFVLDKTVTTLSQQNVTAFISATLNSIPVYYLHHFLNSFSVFHSNFSHFSLFSSVITFTVE